MPVRIGDFLAIQRQLGIRFNLPGKRQPFGPGDRRRLRIGLDARRFPVDRCLKPVLGDVAVGGGDRQRQILPLVRQRDRQDKTSLASLKAEARKGPVEDRTPIRALASVVPDSVSGLRFVTKWSGPRRGRPGS